MDDSVPDPSTPIKDVATKSGRLEEHRQAVIPAVTIARTDRQEIPQSLVPQFLTCLARVSSANHHQG